MCSTVGRCTPVTTGFGSASVTSTSPSRLNNATSSCRTTRNIDTVLLKGLTTAVDAPSDQKTNLSHASLVFVDALRAPREVAFEFCTRHPHQLGHQLRKSQV